MELSPRREVFTVSTLGDNLRFYREKAGFSTAKAFAAAIGMNYATYIAYENRDRQPPAKTLLRIAEALSVPITVLLGYPETERYDDFKRFVIGAGYSLDEDGDKIAVTIPGLDRKAIFSTRSEFCYWIGKALGQCERLTQPIQAHFMKEMLDDFLASTQDGPPDTAALIGKKILAASPAAQAAINEIIRDDEKE